MRGAGSPKGAVQRRPVLQLLGLGWIAMKIVFINPPIRPQAPPNNVPLGIYYLGAHIKHVHPDYQISYVDLNKYRPVPSFEIAPFVLNHLPVADVYMISGLITTYEWQRYILRFLLWHRPLATRIAGGGLASNLGEDYFSQITADAICVGPGEPVILDILEDIQNRDLKRVYRGSPPKDLDSMANIEWDAVDGLETYISNPIWGGTARNSSYIPFTMNRSLSIVTSRGCPRECAFCNRDITGGRRYRTRSAKHVLAEVEHLQKTYSLDFMGFVDDNFAVSQKRLEGLCEGLRGMPIHWGGHPRFDEADDENLLCLMRESGCLYLGFGGESANPDILEAMKKGNDPEQMKRVLGYCRAQGIHPNVTWMMGWPGETRTQVRDTAEFIIKYAPENPRMFVATAYPNTELWDQVESKILDRFGSLIDYVQALGDANLPLVNYTAMPDEEFLEVAEMARTGRLDEI